MKIRQRIWCSSCSKTKKACVCPRGTRSIRSAWGFVGVDAHGKQVRTFKREWSKDDAEREAIAFAQGGKAKQLRSSMTLAAAAERYLETKSRKRSLDEDRRILDHLKSEFGEATPLAEITAPRIAEYRARRLAVKRKDGRPLSAAAVNRPLALLRHLLRLSHEEWGVIGEPPRIRLEREPQGRLRWLTLEEATRLLDACRESRNPDLLDYVELSLFTGMRQGEVLGLTWDRVGRARGVVLLEATKSGKRREVPLTAQADGVLARRAEKAGSPEDGPVFPAGRWDAYRTAWDFAVKRAKLTDFRPHDLRHTFASWAVQRGASLPEVKELLGHASLAMTMRYAHLAPEYLRAAVARLDGLLAQPASSTNGAAEPITHDITHDPLGAP